MQKKYPTEYMIGTWIGKLLYKLFSLVFGIFNYGFIKACKKYKTAAVVHTLLVATIVIFALLYPRFIQVPISLDLYFMFAMAVTIFILEMPEKKRRKYFNKVFDSIGFRSHNGSVPYFIEETPTGDYLYTFSFLSLIPLNEWQKRIDTFKVYFNAEIVEIKTRQNDNRITDIIIQVKPLPSIIPWDNGLIDFGVDSLYFGVSSWGVMDIDLKAYPHTFIAGETGSGKSNVLKCLIHQAIIKEYEVVLIDFKRGVSFASFSDAVEVCYEYKTALKVLEDAVNDTTERLDKFRESRTDNLVDYNKATGEDLQRKIIFIDELAELLKTSDKEIGKALTEYIETLTRLSRSAGIHLIMGIQRPDASVVNGQIKNNVSLRICGRYVDKEPSRIMLGSSDASTLPNIKGRFLVRKDNLYQVQCFYFEDSNYSYDTPKKEVVEPVQVEQPKQEEKVKTGVKHGSHEDTKDTDSDADYIPRHASTQQRTPKVTESLQFDFNDLIKKK